MPSNPNKADAVQPFSLRDAPSLIERLWPAQKISRESEAERKSVAGQTLTGLGGYWKGRKPLILNRACILGALLPATNNPERDLAVFESLMMIDDLAFVERCKIRGPARYAWLALEHGAYTPTALAEHFGVRNPGGRAKPARSSLVKPLTYLDKAALEEAGDNLVWHPKHRHDWKTVAANILSHVPYDDKVKDGVRPEYLETVGPSAHDYMWEDVNAHLGTSATSMTMLVEQLGIMRFGHTPRVGDAFSGSGQIPFEALRLGCDTYASDPNPIAALLTWSSFQLAGMAPGELAEVMADLQIIERNVEQAMAAYETDKKGNRAKAYLYCVEARCPDTGYLVPLVPNLVISPKQGTIGRLVANHQEKRIEIEIVNGASAAKLKAAATGTVSGDQVTYELDGEEYRFSIASVRGDKKKGGVRSNGLRTWQAEDIRPRPDDVFGERLYCIQWAEKESLDGARQDVFYAAPTQDDFAREERVAEIVSGNLQDWRDTGLVPNMAIEPGYNTSQPIRERGWSNWSHLFHPRQILTLSLLHKAIREHERASELYFFMPRALDNASRLNRWKSSQGGGLGGVVGTFDNMALNTLINFAVRGSLGFRSLVSGPARSTKLIAQRRIDTAPGNTVSIDRDIWITDPPYADAVIYHEITEFFISWLRKNPPAPFDGWTWDSRRPIAIQGEGEEFRRKMVETYGNLTDYMPDNGLQIVMFTHQSGSVWADMAQIFWGAGLQVNAAWYIATETSTDLKKGGYVQGTVILVLRKRSGDEAGYEDEIAQEVRAEVGRQIDTLIGLNQSLKGAGRIENLFEDADLQMAGYAAALRVLTGYTRIDGKDMTAEASRPRRKDEKGFVERIIEFAVQVANEHMVPDGLTPRLWQQLSGTERFYLKMVDLEAERLRKLDNYQNFARAFRVPDYTDVMADTRPNSARLKTAADFKHRTGFEIVEFGSGVVRAVLYGVWQLSRDAEPQTVLTQLREMVDSYLKHRDDLVEIAEYIGSRRGREDGREGRFAVLLANLMRNERL